MAVVIVHDEAADPTQRVGRGECRRDQVQGPANRNLEPPAVENHRERPAEESSVPDQAAAREEADRSFSAQYQSLAPMIPPMTAATVMSAAYSSFRPATPQLQRDQPSTHQEADHHHDPVAGDLDEPELEDERIDRHRGLPSRSRDGLPGQGKVGRPGARGRARCARRGRAGTGRPPRSSRRCRC